MKKQKIDHTIIDINDLSIDSTAQMDATLWAAPGQRAKGILVENVDGLIAALKDKGLVD